MCAALSAWELARAIARAQGEARALELKNQLMRENYRAIEGRLRENARRDHELAHQVTALDAAVRARDWAEAERWVSVWKRGRGEDQTRFTGNATVNVILQDAAGQAKAAGVAFEAEVMLPDALPIPDGDLCALLMNMLDNALTGAERTPAGREKRVRFRMRVEISSPSCARTPLTATWRPPRTGRSGPPRGTRTPTASAWPGCGPWRRSTTASWT